MFENQPKGLFALALANTGERFGYYTMIAIFTLFLQAKFGFDEGQASGIYSAFLAGIYFLPLIGGILADKFGYGKMVVTGLAVMFIGYLLLAIPANDNVAYWSMIGALALISLGTGLFKGNLQVMVGNLYDDKRYASKRDTAFSLFYMAINIGAMFAPTAATAMTNWMMGRDGFIYDGRIPSIAHQIIDGTVSQANTDLVQGLIKSGAIATNYTGDLVTFAHQYIESLSRSYNYGFGIACLSLILSAVIYFSCRRLFKHVEGNSKQMVEDAKVANNANVIEEELTPQETRQRITALILVFVVVIFFWMAFHQNGLTLTYFARDYTASTVTGATRMGFNVWILALFAILIYSLFSFLQSKTRKGKTIAGVVAALSLVGAASIYFELPDSFTILPQQFQQFNPFFVVALTPFSLLLFSALGRSGKEPTAPRKIAYGMLIAALAYCLLSFGSIGMPTPAALSADANSLTNPASPNLLIGTYLVLTFAELLLSPMGISFVSKVAPPKLKGAMMGGWFAATAIGNYAVQITGRLWGDLPLTAIWGILIGLCLLAAVFMFSMMRRLEKVC